MCSDRCLLSVGSNYLKLKICMYVRRQKISLIREFNVARKSVLLSLNEEVV